MSASAPMDRIKALVIEHFANQEQAPFVPGVTRIPLAVPTFGWEEVMESIDSLLSTYVTMGSKVREFERLFAQYMGVKHAVMVNSGSSANLLALSVLSSPRGGSRFGPGDEIITPAVTWSTTVSPIVNCGAVPVLVDVDPDTFNINIERLKEAITSRTKAIMVVHLLGNPCNMDEILDVAKEHDLAVIEDTCESIGATYKDKKVGTFGDIGTFSFFFSHHISTVEGGMLVTNSDQYAEIARSMRVFGWARDMDDQTQLVEQYPDVDPRFMFVNPGFNFRPTEIQGAFGIHQIARLDQFIDVRRQNADVWADGLRKHEDYLGFHQEKSGSRHVWFAYPLIIRPDAPFSRKQLTAFLEKNGVETRSVMTGNFAEQPVTRGFANIRTGELPNAEQITRSAFIFGNHAGIGPEEREAVLSYIDEFVAMARAGKLS